MNSTVITRNGCTHGLTRTNKGEGARETPCGCNAINKRNNNSSVNNTTSTFILQFCGLLHVLREGMVEN